MRLTMYIKCCLCLLGKIQQSLRRGETHLELILKVPSTSHPLLQEKDEPRKGGSPPIFDLKGIPLGFSAKEVLDLLESKERLVFSGVKQH